MSAPYYNDDNAPAFKFLHLLVVLYGHSVYTVYYIIVKMCIHFKHRVEEGMKKMQLNYADIGMRIKAERSRQNMSQERLAEYAELSIAHTSHIETGNTKVSLPALVRIANVLETTLDALVCDSVVMAKDAFENEITREIKDCNEYEIRIIADTVKALKASLRKRNHDINN